MQEVTAMKTQDDDKRHWLIEKALWIVMGLLAFLSKDNPDLIFPQALYLFLGLLASSLATGVAIRRAPRKTWLHALCVIASLASIAGLQEWSGGADSNLWALYLMPIFTAAILLEGRELAWTAAGACAANTALHFVDGWRDATLFTLGLENGILLCASAAMWTLSRAERSALATAAQRRREVVHLEQEAAQHRRQENGLTSIAAGGAGAVHDLTTPLMVIKSYARLHLEQGVEDETVRKDFSRIDSAASLCQELVAGIMARASGPTTERSLREAVFNALSMVDPILKSRGISLDCEVRDAVLPVLAAPSDLERILLNLIGNAAKVLPAGGRVKVRMGLAAEDTSQATVDVDDDGPGIPADILPRLFQPFATSKPGAGGNGLGLFVSRAAARRLGGDLTAENRPQGGARFTLRLPLFRAASRNRGASALEIAVGAGD
jgi:signal transduction histidine kinase